MSEEELQELEKALRAAQATDEHFCPDALLPEILPLIAEVRRLRSLLHGLGRGPDGLYPGPAEIDAAVAQAAGSRACAREER